MTPMGEFELIEAIKAGVGRLPEGVVGIGDDCAVIPQKDGLETLVTSDMLIEGVHFIIEDVSPYRLGWKSAAVNLSDIAAMGGWPRGSFLSFALPKSLDSKWVEDFISGYSEISQRFGCPLLGGDTTSSLDSLCISVTLVGECKAGTSKKRSSAKVGDLVCVTGCLGDSAAGLKLILERTGEGRAQVVGPPDEENLIQRHYLPLPRLEEGMRLIASDEVHAMMDISDGIGSDLRHILKASAVGAEIDCASLPLSEELQRVCAKRGWDSVELAISGGEDYELLFTIDPAAEKELDVSHYVIGRITEAASGLKWLGSEKDFRGFTHF